MDIYQEALEFHEKQRGKIVIVPKNALHDRHDLSLQYTPGVAAASTAIAKDPARVWDLTARGNQVAVVSNGTAVLGLGNIGAAAALPVMEGKAVLFKTFGDVDAFPICLDTQDPDAVIAIVKALAPVFGGINLEDIKAPECFYIERELRAALDIPVFHDDQHGTAIVALAGLINAVKVVGKSMAAVKVVISGAGAAGTAIARILHDRGVQDLVLVDSKGIISRDRQDLNAEKRELLDWTNRENLSGDLATAMRGRDIFIGVSVGGLVTQAMVRSMAEKAIIVAMANPEPEIMPDVAIAAGAAIVATGRSDFPNQVNNVLGFPSVFRGALDAKAKKITSAMEIAAAETLAACVASPSATNIIPDPLDRAVYTKVAAAVAAAVEPDNRRA